MLDSRTAGCWAVWTAIVTMLIVVASQGIALAKDFQSDPKPPPASSCPGDQVVWLNTASHIYHFPGQTWFGHTKNGMYMCRHTADAEGDRPTHNGQ